MAEKEPVARAVDLSVQVAENSSAANFEIVVAEAAVAVADFARDLQTTTI